MAPQPRATDDWREKKFRMAETLRAAAGRGEASFGPAAGPTPSRREGGRGGEPAAEVLGGIGAMLAQVELEHLAGLAVGAQAAVVEPDAAGAVVEDGLGVVGDQEHRGAGVVEALDAFFALVGEGGI